MEQRFHLRLQIRPHDRLGDPVRHGGHAEHADPLASCLRYLHRTHRRREVRPRGHPIPELVEVPFQVPLELCDRLPVDTRGPLVGLDLLVGLPDNPLGNLKRLGRFGFDMLTGSSRPSAVDRQTSPNDPAPSLRPHYQASPLLRAGPSLCPASVLCPSQFPLLGVLPLATGRPSRPVTGRRIGATGSHVPHQSLS